MMKLAQLSEELREKRMTDDAEISGLCTDSRVAGKGDLFLCFRGTHRDSHQYAEEAVKRGASAIVCEHELPVNCPQLIVPDGREAIARVAAGFYGHPERGLRIAGITGTNGKTTVSYMLRNILSRWGKRTGIIGTLGARYSDRTVEPALTTPDPLFLFSLLADMKKEGTEYVVMEVSAHALALKKVCPVTFDVGIFTNLTRDHLDFFGDMEKYGEAKKNLFLPEHCRRAVLNADDGFSRTLEQTGTPYLTYGLESPADAFAVVEEESLRACRLLINLNDELCETNLSLTGRHNVYNALAAACAANILGADMPSVAEGIARTVSVDGRLEWTASFRGADIFVDFAHTPDGLEKSLSALKEHCTGRLIALFGCGGNRDSGKRAEMGERAARLCDFCVITSDNPRFEDPCAIISEIEKGYRKISDRYVTVEERQKATEYAVNMLKKGDILLVAGKGGETYQEIMGIKYDYNDKDVIQSVIGRLS